MRRLFLFILLNCGLRLSLPAQEIWSLEKCIRQAIQENLNLRLSRLGVESGRIDLQENQWRRSPDLNANINGGISVGRNIDPTTNLLISQDILFGSGSLSSTVILFQGGMIHHGIQQAKHNLKAAQEDFSQAQNDLALLVANLYLSVLLSEDRLEAAREDLKLRLLTLDQISKLVRSGARPEADLFEIQTQIALAEQSVVQASNTLDLTWLNLKQAMRMPADAPMKLERMEESRFQNISGLDYRLEDLVSRSEKNLPQLKSAHWRLEAAKSTEKITRAAFFPSLFGSFNLNSRYSDAAVIPTRFNTETLTVPGIQIDGKSVVFQQTVPRVAETSVIPFQDQLDQFFGYGVGVGLSIPLFNRMSTWSNVKRSKLQSLRAEINLSQQKDKTRQDITQAFTQYQAAIKQYEAALKSSELAQKSFEMTNKRFELGSASLFDLNQSQMNYRISQNNWIVARYDLLFKKEVLEFYAGNGLKF